MDQLILEFERIEGIRTEYAVLPLEDVSPESEMAERGLVSKPARAFVDSLRQFGQIDPILVLEKVEADGSKWYQVWSGSRRVRAIRQLAAYGEHEPTIKAQVIKEEWNVPYDVLMMVLNAARDSNEIADYFAIRRLMQDNPELNMADIAKALNHNLTHPEIRKRLSLARIPEPLLNGVTSGMLTLQTARTIAKLPKKVQIDLSDRVQVALERIKDTESTKFADPNQKQETLKDIIREGRIAASAIRQMKVDHATQVASLKLGSLLINNDQLPSSSTEVDRKKYLVLPVTQGESFSTKKKAELYRQKVTGETGVQHRIVEL